LAVDGLAPCLSTDPAVERFSEYRDTHQLEAFSVDADRIPSPYRANEVRSFEVRDNLLGSKSSSAKKASASDAVGSAPGLQDALLPKLEHSGQS